MPEQAVWSGARPRPARLVDVVMFAWELDILEIRLHELEEVVDVFVIIESAFSQRGIPKPLVLAATMSRFERFRHKIVYITQDDVHFRTKLSRVARPSQRGGRLPPKWEAYLSNGTIPAASVDGFEWINEDNRLDAAKEWMRLDAALRPPNTTEETLYLFSDLDEVPNAQALLHVKHCEPAKWPAPQGKVKAGPEPVDLFRLPPLRFALHRFNFDAEHVTGARDAPIHVIKDPEHSVLRYTGYPVAPYELGLGAHLSRCVSPVALMLKSWLQAESSEFRSDEEHLTALNVEAWYDRVRAAWIKKSRATGQSTWLPWFLEHNRERFPYLFPSRFPEWKQHYIPVRDDKASRVAREKWHMRN